ncbi:MAG TPA: DEAD/DEAH box helicase, partial [Opitutae bacterium]|nr:DEAD/DEAH box helicase [Opitutae bacterium]
MAQTFVDLGIPSDLILGIEELGIETPTPIQQQVIPFLIKDGTDLIAQAQTGTGKTAAFGLPLLTKMDPDKAEIQGLIIAPTRELAKQIGKQLFKYTKYAQDKIFVEVAAGGDKIEMQIERLSRPTHILVATPGRLMELLDAQMHLESVNYLILDEADEM